MPRFPSLAPALPPDLTAGRPARLVLALAVVATLAGTLVTVWRGGSSGWNSWLFLERNFSHAAAFRTELVIVAAALACSLAALFPKGTRAGGGLMLPAFAFLLGEALLTARMGGVGHAEWAPAAHALRYATPLALVLLATRAPVGGAQAAVLLRVALAFVFFTHGVEALLHYARFIDLVIGSAENLCGWRVTETQAKELLSLIGAVDIASAVLVLVRPAPALLWWMAAWGLVTALSRVTGLGWDASRDVLVRATHFLVPLVLALHRARGDGERGS